MQKRGKIFIICLGLLLIWLRFIYLSGFEAFNSELTLATAIYFVCSLPLLIYFLRSEKNIPYLSFFSIFYFVYFGLSIFNSYDLFRIEYLNPEIISKCLYLVLGGIISLLVAFYTPLGKITNLVNIHIKLPWAPQKAYFIGSFSGLLGIFAQYFNLDKILSGGFAGVAGFITSLSRLGVALLFMLQLQNRLKFSGKLLLWVGLFIPKVLLDLSTGSTLPIILDFMIIFLLYFYFRQSVPWLMLIIVLVIFFNIFSVRDKYRELTWFSEDYANARPTEKIALYIKLLYERMNGEEEYKYAYSKLSARADALVTFAKVVELTPNYIPYWEGYTYNTLITSLVPRFIMPGKPEKILGQEFGHRYMFLAPSDTTTSYNLPFLIEMYINFGPWGVIIGMYIIGLIFRLFYTLFNHADTGEGGILISAMVFMNLLNIESDFSLIFGLILQYIVLFYILIRMMRLPPQRIEGIK